MHSNTLCQAWYRSCDAAEISYSKLDAPHHFLRTFKCCKRVPILSVDLITLSTRPTGASMHISPCREFNFEEVICSCYHTLPLTLPNAEVASKMCQGKELGDQSC